MSTIAAISTAIGTSGIGIVRMSGDKSFYVLNKIFKPKKDFNIDEIKGYSIKYGYIMDEDRVIDEVLVSFFKAPSSYTTEDLCEISSHGGTFVVKKILELCLKNGANLAEPGEFTKRAFLNGRIDLSQAEAVIDIINSRTDKEAKSSINQLEGSLSRQIGKIRDLLMQIMVNIEVSIDYPEYDEANEIQSTNTLQILQEVKENLESLEKSFENGKIIKEGIKLALIGKPNAGKSSLLNAILQEERAIVTAVEGTTRDTIEEDVSINGIPLHIIDTAGIRNSTNEVEKIGIEKSRKMAQDADLIIAIFDCSTELTNEDLEILKLLIGKKCIVVLNKVDLGINKVNKSAFKPVADSSNIIEISAKEGIGIEKIYDKITEMFNINEISLDDSTIVTNVRHKNIIVKAIEYTNNAIDDIKKNVPMDIMSISVKEILEELGKITGESVSDEIIKEIFSNFCLGK